MKTVNESTVELIDSMGNDLTVVNAARVSFDKQSEYRTIGVQEEYDVDSRLISHYPIEVLKEEDEKLIKYLARHNHWSPFAHTGITLRVSAPIFVARQLVKHQVGGVWNEVSRRYVDDEITVYLPDILRTKAEHVKQGSSDVPCVPTGKDGVCPNCGTPFVSKGNTQKYCSSKCQGEHYRKMPWGWRKKKLATLRSSADRRGIKCTLTEEDIEMPVLCPYLDIPLDYTNDSIQDNSPSVDRIDNTKGYIAGNIQTISALANKMKTDSDLTTLTKFAKSVLMRHSGIMVEPYSGLYGAYKQMCDLYDSLITQGVAPEQARMFLPQGAMTSWYWTGSLMFFHRVFRQRTDSHAQLETQEVALQIGNICAKLFPVSWKALGEKQ